MKAANNYEEKDLILVALVDDTFLKPCSFMVTFQEQGITENDIIAICQKDQYNQYKEIRPGMIPAIIEGFSNVGAYLAEMLFMNARVNQKRTPTDSADELN